MVQYTTASAAVVRKLLRHDAIGGDLVLLTETIHSEAMHSEIIPRYIFSHLKNQNDQILLECGSLLMIVYGTHTGAHRFKYTRDAQGRMQMACHPNLIYGDIKDKK